ncbi:hypothetical protein MMO39_04595 [Acinetobacter modestus]|uniref:MltR family transcriptional regulator n=1 Tax=Acinetobacter modestus TaxID=1776740 RepID=UPI001F4AA9C6|nr:MltR family transcriptional regulator [Acinetobacter modestus]MCH7386579.1 hypothetical protein [Acinetobacter modestus]
MADKDKDREITIDDYERVSSEVNSMMDDLADQLPPRAKELFNEVRAFRSSITEETDRGAVLMSAAFLDEKLKQIIEKRMVQDRKTLQKAFDFNGPLGTFSSRIDFCYLIGIIPKNAQKDLHTVRAIRNQFAHHAAPLSYEDEKVKNLCSQLVFHGIKNPVDGGSRFRRSVMGLLIYINSVFESIEHIAAAPDYVIPDRSDVYIAISDVFTKITGMEYPLKHEHE